MSIGFPERGEGVGDPRITEILSENIANTEIPCRNTAILCPDIQVRKFKYLFLFLFICTTPVLSQGFSGRALIMN